MGKNWNGRDLGNGIPGWGRSMSECSAAGMKRKDVRNRKTNQAGVESSCWRIVGDNFG